MRATLQATTNAVLVTAVDGSITDYNDKFTEMWGVHELLSRGETEPLRAELSALCAEPDLFLRRISDINAAQEASSFDTLVLRDGRIIERYSNPQVVAGCVVGRVWSFADVTAARQTELALRDETRVLALLNRLGLNLTANLGLRQAVQAITDAGVEITGASYGAFFSSPALAPAAGVRHAQLRTSAGERHRFMRLARAVASALKQDVAWPRVQRIGDLLAASSCPAWAARAGAARSLLLVPVVSRTGQVLGVLCFAHEAAEVFSQHGEDIVCGIAAEAAMVIDTARQDARRSRELRASRASLALQRDYLSRLQNLSRRLIQAETDQGRRLSRELHDRVGSNLSALLLTTALLRKEVMPAPGETLDRRLGQLEQTVQTTMDHVRDVLSELRPAVLEELGLVAALRHEASLLTERSNVRFVVVARREPSPRLEPACEMAFFRIAQEAWTNVQKHARAQRVVLKLSAGRHRTVMQIEDDGEGFVPRATRGAPPTLGLTTMRERAQAIGATLKVDQVAGSGVRLQVILPVRKQAGGS